MGILTDEIIKSHKILPICFGIIASRAPEKKSEIVKNDAFVAENNKKPVDKLLILWYSYVKITDKRFVNGYQFATAPESARKRRSAMPRFFVEPRHVCDDVVTLEGENARHITLSLRLAVGDHITVCDRTAVYDCELIFFDGQIVKAHVLTATPIDTEPPYVAHLYQALPKGDKLDTVIQKAVECGAAEIRPFESSRCVMRAKPEAEERKTERRRRIAEEAAKQCGRGVIPTVGSTIGFTTMLSLASSADLALFCYEGEGTTSLKEVLDDALPVIPKDAEHPPHIAIIIGSEGGFSPEEAAAAQAQGCRLTGLGRRILRTETVSGFVLGCLSYRYEL